LSLPGLAALLLPDAGHDPGETREHLTKLRRNRVLLPGEVLELATSRTDGELRLGPRLGEQAVRLGPSVVDGLLRERLGLLDRVVGQALRLDAASLGPRFDLARPLLGGPSPALGLAHELVRVRHRGGVALRLLAFGLLPPLGELERECLQFLVATILRLGVQLGGLGALLLRLP